MQIRKILALMGPNVWTNRPVLEAWVDLGHFEDYPSNTLPHFNERLTAWLPSLIEHRCSVGTRGGFLERLRDGTWLGHVLEHVTLELESLSHTPLGFGRARETSERGVYKVVVACEEPRFGEECLRTARELVLAAVDGREFDVQGEIRRLATLADSLCLGPSTNAIVKAAKERGIPAIRISEGNLVQLGYGKAQRRIWTAETQHTGAIAEAIAQDKQLTRRLLASVGLCVPAGRVVESPEDAWAAALELGLPVVVKPRDANHGRGVSIRLEERTAVETAFHFAAKEGSGVLVERFIPGSQHRVLVVGDRAVAASGGQADEVVADGQHTVEELVAIANRDPRRGEDSAQQLTTIVLDDISLELLRRQGLEAKTVPEAGRKVVLCYNGDLTIDETDRLHPEIAANAVLAAQTVGLDVAGIDLIAEDIGRPLERQGGAIIEVNASPGLVMHLKPIVGTPRPVGEAIVAHLFDAGETGRVPIAAIAGTNGKTHVSSLLGAMLSEAGRALGQADSRGIHARGRWLERGECTNAESARRVLMNPFVDTVVLEVAESSVLEEGLGFDRCEVAVITNVGSGDHLGRRYVETVDLIEKAIRAPLDVVVPGGAAVLNADDPSVVRMIAHFKGSKVVYFGRRPDAEPLRAHLAAGERAVIFEEGRIVALTGARREYLAEVDRLSLAAFGTPGMFLENLMAASAAALAMGLTPATLRTFFARGSSGEEISIFEREAAVAIASVCTNPSALAAWIDAAHAGFPGFRLHAALEISEDSRIEDARAMATLLSGSFASVTATAGTGPLHAALREVFEPSSATLYRSSDGWLASVTESAERLGPKELLFVLSASRAGVRVALSCLAEKGMRRRPSAGLQSTELE